MERMKNGESRSFAWLDWMVLLALLAVVLSIGAFVWMGMHKNEERSGLLHYTVLLSGVDESLLGERMQAAQLIGKTVRSENGTAVLGEIVSVERTEHQMAVASKNVVEFVTVPNRADYYITVRCMATDRGAEGIRAKDIRIAAGESFHLRLGDLLTKGATVIDLKWEAEDED